MTTNARFEATAIDTAHMQHALVLAAEAGAAGDVPVGAVVVHHGDGGADRVIATAQNRRERDLDPTAHAEIVALRRAAASLKTWRLGDCTLYVTLEPCFMCAGALVNARLGRLVYGAADPKGGASGSLHDVCRDPRLNHTVTVQSGVLAAECGDALRMFFASRRKNARPAAPSAPGEQKDAP